MRAGSLRYTASFYAPADTVPRPSGQRPTEYSPAPYAANWPVELEAIGSDEGDTGAGRRSSTTYRLNLRTPERVPEMPDKAVLNDGTELFITGVLDRGRECEITARWEA